MLYFLIVWLILFIVCYPLGLLIINICQADIFKRTGDRFIMSLWLGIIVISLVNMTVILFLPLSTFIGLLIGLVSLIVAILHSKTRQDLIKIKHSLSLNPIIKGIAISIIVAIFNSQKIIWFDTGLYHLNSIRWMGEYGLVNGISLIQPHLGFTSSWFAFSAPLIINWQSENIGAVSSGFVFLILLFWGLICLAQGLEKNGKLSDFFGFTFASLITFIYLIDNNNGFSIVSFSNDILIAFLSGVFVWYLLILNDPDNLIPKSNFLVKETLLIIIAVGAFSVKLTGLPFLLVGILIFSYYFWQKRIKIKPFLVGLILCLILLLPNLIFAVKTSGCPLYPSQIICFDVPWTRSADKIDSQMNIVSDIKVNQGKNQKQNLIFKAIRIRYERLISSLKQKVTYLIYLVSLALGVYIFFGKRNPHQGEKESVFFAVVCMTFVMIVNPLIRFGLGYFLTIPALFFAHYFLHFLQAHKYSHVIKNITISILILMLLFRGWDNLNERLLLPPQLPKVSLIKTKINNIEYYYPDYWTSQCWAAKLPCSFIPIKHNIELINPQQGIKGGFKWQEEK